MATYTKTTFQIFQDEFWAGVFEAIDQRVTDFEAATNGAIRVVTNQSRGDFQKESILDDTSFITRRDVTVVTSATDIDLTQSVEIRPKIDRKIGPIAKTLDAWKKIGSNESEMSLLVGQMTGPQILQDYLNTAVRGAVGAITGIAGAYNNQGNTKIVTSDLADTLAKMGDAADQVICWVMNSATAFALLKDQVGTTYNALDSVAGTAVIRGTIATFGRPVYVTDSSALTITGSPDDYITLGLTAGALTLIESEERTVVGQVITGTENLQFRIQGEYAFNLKVKGYSYTSATVNPADSDLTTTGNWAQVRHTKQGAGVAQRNNSV